MEPHDEGTLGAWQRDNRRATHDGSLGGVYTELGLTQGRAVATKLERGEYQCIGGPADGMMLGVSPPQAAGASIRVRLRNRNLFWEHDPIRPTLDAEYVLGDDARLYWTYRRKWCGK